ncbi:MAG: efflux RND transporter permease subunit, partial [Desulfuromonadales bacterium]|nr:efflux RND transporter permease subunit [Desulfuromonadales bacterium]
EELSRIGQQVEAVVRGIPGTLTAFSERVVGGYYLDYEIDRAAIARYGLTVSDVQDIIQSALGGMNVTQTVEGLERYSVNIRYMRDYRSDLQSLERILVPLKNGKHIPISQVANIEVRQGPPMIKSENARQTAWVYVDIRGIDVGTYVENAREVISETITLPEGYSLIWSGQYEYMQSLKEKMVLAIPLTLIIIFVIIYMSTGSMIKTGIVLLAVPFSLVGCFWFLYLLGYHMSAAVAVGIIALAGLDAETGVIMLLYLDLAHEKWQKSGRLLTRGDLVQSIHYGAVKRIRPKVMTITIIIAGLLPIMWSHGAGADTMKRIAAPMIGGVVTSGIMELLVYPVIYFLWRSRALKDDMQPTSTEEITEH